MELCWNASPELRPNFQTLIEKLGYCLADPQVLQTPLHVFTRAASEDTTVMRPPPESGYLVPNKPSSTYSFSSERTELMSPDTCSTVTTDDMRFAELMEEVRASAASRPIRRFEWRESPLTTPSPPPTAESPSQMRLSPSPTERPGPSSSKVVTKIASNHVSKNDQPINDEREVEIGEEPLNPGKLIESQKPIRYVNV